MSSPRNLLIYDDGCPMCTFQSRLLGWLDWFHRLRPLPISSPEAREAAPEITREQLLEAIHCVTPSGTIHRGARALRHVGFRIPLLFPLSLILWIPGVILIAEIAYRWVSRNRHLLSRLFGCKEACSILPERRDHRGEDSPAEPTPPAAER